MSFAIQTEGFSKHFADVQAVDNLSLHVKYGEIYAFLGKNGAGKTTTIRALLGMIRPNAGKVYVLGEEIGRHRHALWKNVGHSVERPAAYPELTLRENLEIARRLHNIADKDAVERVIKELGIQTYENRKAGHLSTGNFQRLALARALLHQPKLLIIDEPASGLDPAGVVEIRRLLKKLVTETGMTIFMSSHILTEVNHLADRIGIIHQGKLINEFDAATLKGLRSQRLEIETRDLKRAKRVLQDAGFEPKQNGEMLLLNAADAIKSPERIATLLVKSKCAPSRLAVMQENLEEYFLRLTGGQP